MRCDAHAVRRWEWKGSRSDHRCGQEVTAGTEGEIGTPSGLGPMCLGYWPAFSLQTGQSGTNWQASSCLHLLDGWERTAGSRVLLAFCYSMLFSRAFNETPHWHIWARDGPTCKIKAIWPNLANFSVEAKAASSLWLSVLWLLDLNMYAICPCGLAGWVPLLGCFSHCL